MARKLIGTTQPDTQQLSSSETQEQPFDIKNTTQGVSNFLRDMGLGLIPDTLATGYEIPRAVRQSVMKDNSGYINQGSGKYVENPFMNKEDLIKSSSPVEGTKRAARNFAGAASWAIPVGKGPLLGKMALGAASGGLSAASQEKATKESIGTSALLGATLPVAFAGGEKVLRTIGKGGKALAGQMFKPTVKEIGELRKFGKTDFFDEFVKRDLPNVANKNSDEIAGYFANKVGELNGATDDFLRQANKTVKKAQLEKYIDDTVKPLQQPGRLFQDQTIQRLQSLKDQLAQVGDDVNLVTVNQMKRDIQNIADSAYSLNASDPAAKKLASVATSFNNLIEEMAPGTKDINRKIMYYRLADTTFQRARDQAAKSGGGLVGRLTGAGAMGGLAYGAMTANPAVAGAAVLPLVLESLLRNPKYQGKVGQALIKAGNAKTPELLQKLLLLGPLGATRDIDQESEPSDY